MIELRSKAPLIRLDIFRTRSLTASNTAMLLVASGLFAMFFFASLYVQQLRGYSPIKAGLAFLPFTFGIVIGAGLAQSLIKRIGVRAVTITGLSIATVGMLLYTQLSLTGSYFGQLFPAVMVTSIGMGLAFVPVTLLATTNVPSEDAGLASGPLQHVAADRRRARPRDPLDARRVADEPQGRGARARRRARRAAITSRSSSARSGWRPRSACSCC